MRKCQTYLVRSRVLTGGFVAPDHSQSPNHPRRKGQSGASPLWTCSNMRKPWMLMRGRMQTCNKCSRCRVRIPLSSDLSEDVLHKKDRISALSNSDVPPTSSSPQKPAMSPEAAPMTRNGSTATNGPARQYRVILQDEKPKGKSDRFAQAP